MKKEERAVQNKEGLQNKPIKEEHKGKMKKKEIFMH